METYYKSIKLAGVLPLIITEKKKKRREKKKIQIQIEERETCETCETL